MKKNRATQNWLNETKLFFFVNWAEEEKKCRENCWHFLKFNNEKKCKMHTRSQKFPRDPFVEKFAKVFAYASVIKADKIIKDFSRFLLILSIQCS